MFGATTPGSMAVLAAQLDAMMTDELRAGASGPIVRGRVQTDPAITVTESAYSGLSTYHQLADIYVPLSAELPANITEFTVTKTGNGEPAGQIFRVIGRSADTGAPYRRYKCRASAWSPTVDPL